MTQVSYKAEIEITSQMIADQIITAIEGGSNYWCDGFFLQNCTLDGQTVEWRMNKSRPPLENPWYSDKRVYEGPFEIHVTEIGENAHKVLNPERINRGLEWLSKNQPGRITEIVSEEGDAETADVFLQACVLGEIVYG